MQGQKTYAERPMPLPSSMARGRCDERTCGDKRGLFILVVSCLKIDVLAICWCGSR